MTGEMRQNPDEFFNWELIRATPEYINSIRIVLRDRVANSELGAEVITTVFSLADAKKFIEDKKLSITYDQLIYAADENYKQYQKTGDIWTGTRLN